ncbi:hypothetical protein D3C87_1967500 [compost metagenome]
MKRIFLPFTAGFDREDSFPFLLRTVGHEEQIKIPCFSQHSVADGALPKLLPAVLLGMAHHNSGYITLNRKSDKRGRELTQM